MKKSVLNVFIICAILLIASGSCEKNKTDNSDQLEKVKKILELEARMNAINNGAGKMTGFMSVIGYSQFKDGKLNIESSGSEPGYPDSTVIDTSGYWTWITCANVSEFDNEDGSHTTIYDYGDGCEEYGSLFKGKITYIWRDDNNNYYSMVIYDHYYSFGTEMNGHSEYTFTSDGDSYYSVGSRVNDGDSTISIMPILFNWSGTSTGHDELTMIYDDGHSTFFKSDYVNVWDSTSYKVIQGEYFYSSESEGFEYHYLVESPLITNYLCPDVWVPVSGIETITTTEKGETQEYSLNYGDGTCDNLAELTENGKTSIIDFGELYKVIEGGDVTVVPSNGRKGFR